LNKRGFPALAALFRVELEGCGKKFGQSGGDGLAVCRGVEDDGIGAGELEDGLAAGTAGQAGGAVEVDDCDGADADGGAEESDGRGDGGLLRA